MACYMESSPQRIFEISPNLSLTPRGAAIFFVAVLLSTILVSGSAAWLGYWPVLPFAGLELLILAFALYSVQRRGRYKEVLHIGDEKIVVEKGENNVQERLEFVRHWTRVEIRPGNRTSGVSRLLLSGQGLSCEIGECLTQSERVGLAHRLEKFIGPVNASPPLVGVTTGEDDPS